MKKEDVMGIKISDYDYPLPEYNIARYPLSERDSSKMLVYRQGDVVSHSFKDLPDLLPQEALLLYNNTRVIHARMLFNKQSGAQIEIFCLSPNMPEDYNINFRQRQHSAWNCLVGNARRWKESTLHREIDIDGNKLLLSASKLSEKNGTAVVQFSWNNSDYTFSDILENAGEIPIPPYLNRHAEKSDDRTYQTVYSSVEGSVAAPTAGLHFTGEMFDRLKRSGVDFAEITLHVGAGTFKPVKSDTIGGHKMHSEFISVSRNSIEKLLNHNGSIVVVGTTSMRTLESLYYVGMKLGEDEEYYPKEGEMISVNQWDPYIDDEAESKLLSPNQSLLNILNYLSVRNEEYLVAETGLMIAPGYKFKFADCLITNFHQPQSTLLLLVSAFVGEDWKKIYDFALKNDYRFLSYGDSSLLWRRSC